MIDLCRFAVSVGERKGADEAEAVWTEKVSTAVKAELGQISKVLLTEAEGLRIRVVKDKAMASTFTNRLDDHSLEKAVERALNAAKASKKDENWDSLPLPRKYPRVDLWDPKIETVSSEDLTEPVVEILRAMPKDVRVHAAAHEVIYQKRACVNSRGIAHEDRQTQENFVVQAVGILKEGVTPGFYGASFSREYNPEPSRLVEELVANFTLFKKVDTATSGEFSVIFSPLALQKLFHYTLFRALSGENVARQKSLLAGKEGERVASPEFTLHDNGISLQGIGSGEMDDEGVPRQDTPLVEKGILRGFIWNDYWGKRNGCSSTGNAHYNEGLGEMSIRYTTMMVAPGDCTKEELFAIKDGYHVLDLQGAHGSNPESGDFSVMCNPAYRIRDGEIEGCLGMMVSDNVFSLLQRIDAVGREPEVREFAILPPVRFSDVNVAAK